VADTEFGSPAPEDVEASETAAAIAAGIPLEDEETDEMEAAYEATQREVEQEIHGSAEEPAEETLLAGKYKTVEDLEKAYIHSESKIGELGPKASESQELRERLARLEGQAQARPVQAQPVQPQYDPRVQTRQAFANQRQRVYMDQGLDEASARDVAQKDVVALGMFVDAEIGNRTQRYDAALQVNERERLLQSNAYNMREEKTRSGNPVRPNWDQVVSTKEFEDAARNMGDNFYTKQGLELAYLRTLPSVEARQREESSGASGAARANSSAAKRRASVGPAATPTAKTRSNKSSDDAEIEAIYESARAAKRSSNVFDGGGFGN